MCCHWQSRYVFVLSEVVVGFRNESITIPEGQGSLELCATILSPDPDELPDTAFVLADIYLESDTATSKAEEKSMERGREEKEGKGD